MHRVESARWSRQLTLRRREIGVVSQRFPPVSVVRKPPSAQKRGKRCVMSRRVQNQRQIKRDCGKGRRKMKTKELDCVPLDYNKFSLKNRLVIYIYPFTRKQIFQTHAVHQSRSLYCVLNNVITEYWAQIHPDVK